MRGWPVHGPFLMIGGRTLGGVELVLIAVGLSMDAFAVSICKGLVLDRATVKNAAIVGGYFGLFQALMPLLGYLIGAQFSSLIEAYDHWVAFFLLLFIGGKMIYECLRDRKAGETETADAERGTDCLSIKNMLPYAIATSIDALAVGISFAFLKVDILPAILSIGFITLVLSMLGVKIGNLFGTRFKSQAELAGGVILLLIGIKILIEHLSL